MGNFLKNGFIFYIGLTLFYYVPTFADVQQQGKFWPMVDLSGSFLGLKSVLYDTYVQGRYNMSEHEYEGTRTEAGLGYKITPRLSGWLGYTWVLQNANINQEHRIWEQVLWQLVSNEQFHFSSRTRLIQRKQAYQPEWGEQLRQRFALSLPHKIAHQYTPVFSDEVFFNLNNAVWVNHRMVDQNRAFIGVLIPIVPLFEHADLQIGYMNQYIFQARKDIMNHILYVSLNMVT